MNAVISDRPDDLIVSTHMCRGNFRSRWVASGGYEPIAEAIFGWLDVDAFFLEFDERSIGWLRAPASPRPRQDGRARSGHDQDAPARRPGQAQAPDRRGYRVRADSNSSRSARSAGSRAATTATTSPRTISGTSCASSSTSPTRSGGADPAPSHGQPASRGPQRPTGTSEQSARPARVPPDRPLDLWRDARTAISSRIASWSLATRLNSSAPMSTGVASTSRLQRDSSSIMSSM